MSPTGKRAKKSEQAERPRRENPPPIEHVRAHWVDAWPAALAHWSRYVQLHEPVWCETVEREKEESLTGSFAMIRLVDHSVVISLRQVIDEGLEGFATEILAHEVGHHVYCPADLTDNARLLARIRRGLPTKEIYAPMVSNLYSDLLINDRLQRSESLDIAGVYRALSGDTKSRLWTLYLRIYEVLWSLPAKTLCQGECDKRMLQDAHLGARVIRSYARDWLEGGGRFAALCLPYIIDDDEKCQGKCACPWGDTLNAGAGACPDGLTEIDDAELSGAIHPVEDPELSGLEELGDQEGDGRCIGRTPGELSGRKTLKNYRQPFEYAEVLKAAGVDLDLRELTARYYQERAIPYLVPFPAQRFPSATDPLPEGLDVWDVGGPLERIDWMGTMMAGPQVIPGVTTRERLDGENPGREPDELPFDLYLGIDCSGSMGDPAHHVSYPVLAGAIIALSALRAGSRVKVVLSGEPGRTKSTDGFLRDRPTIMKTLASYLGTGYSFGIHRLRETFTEPAAKKSRRPVHILIVSDTDMFSMLDSEGDKRLGWDVAADSLQRCGGGGTFVLQIPERMRQHDSVQRMLREGWNVSLVSTMEELVEFAREFSRRNYALK